jgi:hypothetical protein
VDERRAAEHRVRLEELKKAYQGLLPVESAAADGVSYVDYGKRMHDATVALATYEAKEDQAKKIRAHLAAALDQYRVAYELMELIVDYGWRAETSKSWFASYRKRHPTRYLGSATTGQGAYRDCWSSAHAEMDAARAGLAAYENAR